MLLDETLYAQDLMGMTAEEVVAYLSEWENVFELEGRAELAKSNRCPPFDWFSSPILGTRECLIVSVRYKNNVVVESEVRMMKAKRK